MIGNRGTSFERPRKTPEQTAKKTPKETPEETVKKQFTKGTESVKINNGL